MQQPAEQPAPPRVACLLPSATEILGALDLAHCIVALTHECDLAPDAASLDALMAGAAPPPRVTSTAINPHAMAQAEIDDAVKRSVASGLSLYTVDQAALLNARPTLVITQALCAVCAAATAEVDAVCVDIAQQLEASGDGIGSSLRVLSLQPSDLVTVAESFETVASACGVPERGISLRENFESTLRRVGEVCSPKLTVAFSQSSYILMTYRVVGAGCSRQRSRARSIRLAARMARPRV